VPLGILEPAEIVDGVIEIYVDVIRLEAPQAASSASKIARLLVSGRARVFRRQEYILAFAAQRVSERGLRLPRPDRFRGVEINDAEIDGVSDEVSPRR